MEAAKSNLVTEMERDFVPSATLATFASERREPTVGGVPVRVSEDLVDWGVYGLEPSDPRARPFVLLRTQIMATAQRMKARCIAVTSPKAGEGKSYVAANLATAISRVADVCLVDLHLRRPVVAEWFDLPAKGGTAGVLGGRQSMAEGYYRVEGERLGIIPVGLLQEDASMLVSLGTVDTLVEQLRGLPGEPLCILDCPPVLENDDMLQIARHVDAIILIAEEGKTTQGDLGESARLLRPTPVLGTLLNRSIVPAAFPS